MSEKKIKRNVIKVAMLGDSEVGKTSICNNLMNLEFNDNALSTIGTEKLETQVKLKNGEEKKLVIWDTAGQERFHSIALKTIRTVQGIVVVFSFNCRKSFENVVVWLNQIKDNTNNATIALFGNKCDFDENSWEVTRDEAIKFAKEKGLPFFETSAKIGKGIKEGFDYIVNTAYEKVEGNAGIEITKENHQEVHKKSKCFGGGGDGESKKSKKKEK